MRKLMRKLIRKLMRKLMKIFIKYITKSKSSFRWTFWAPLHFWAIYARPVSYYAFFKGWLPPSLPTGCLCTNTIFPTKKLLRDLNERWGLFPFWLSTLAPKVCLQYRSRHLFLKRFLITGIRSFHEIGTILDRPQPRSALPPAYIPILCSTYIDFAENQLFPSSIGFSPLGASHPRLLQQTWVQSFRKFYLSFNLLTPRSLGFGSNWLNSTCCTYVQMRELP